MEAIILYSVAEYCDYFTKLTIKWQDKQIKTEFWASDRNDVLIETKDYLSKNKAYKAYKEMIGGSILGGWQVLNAFPQKETWETKRSK